MHCIVLFRHNTYHSNFILTFADSFVSIQLSKHLLLRLPVLFSLYIYKYMFKSLTKKKCLNPPKNSQSFLPNYMCIHVNMHHACMSIFYMQIVLKKKIYNWVNLKPFINFFLKKPKSSINYPILWNHNGRNETLS